MSTTVDQRVVEMRFDNKQFESNVSDTMSLLDKFKQKLNLDGASRGLEEVNTAAKRVDMSCLGSAVEAVQAKFSALQVMGVTALANLTNSAVNAGKRMISALTIDPIKTGFNEYETKINAIQTIMSNTASKGTTMEDVTRVIGELNTYADKTIYNFAEMTRNIGTFTAAGVGLEESASAIQGIANLAAASGSSSQQASTAMYQLSQAMASGTVKLMDWNSVVNAGMGGQKFQDALKATAKEHGIAIDGIIKKNGSFRESLQEGWLSTDILNETLQKFTVEGAKEYAKSMVDSGKYTQEQADALIKEAQAMEDAATKVKTFTQLWDTLKESAQSGWSQTWEIIVGDFEEAKETLTKFSEVIGEIINESAEARNNLLQGWKDAGGRADLVDSLFNVFESIRSVVAPIKEAFDEIFPPLTVQQLVDFTKGLKELTAKLKLSDKASDNLKRTFKGLFAVVDIVRQFFVAAFNAIKPLFGGLDDLGGGVLGVTAKLGDWLVNLSNTIRESKIFSKVLNGLVTAIKFVFGGLTNLLKLFKDKVAVPGWKLLHSFMDKLGDRMSGIVEVAVAMKDGVIKAFNAIGDALSRCNLVKILEMVWNVIKTIGVAVGKLFGGVADGIMSTFSKGGFNGILDIFNSILAGGLIVKVINFVKQLEGIAEGLDLKQLASGFMEEVTGAMGALRGSLEGYQQKLKAEVIMQIAQAIIVLAAALLVLSVIDSDKLTQSIGAMTVLFTELMTAMAVVSKITSNASMINVALGMSALASALLVLSFALAIMSTLSLKELGIGLGGIAVGLGLLVGAVNLLPDAKVKSAAKAIKTMSTALLILSIALKIMSTMSWEELGRGLVTMTGGLGLLVAAVNLLPKDTSLKVAGMVGFATAIVILAAALKIMSTMSWSEMAVGLVSLAGAMAILVISLNLMKSALPGAAAMMIVAPALVVLASALKILSTMSWEEIGKGLVAIGGALLMLAVGLNAMTSAIAGAAALFVAAGAIAILAPALTLLGSMSWESIIKGLVAVAGALTIIGVAALILTPVIPAITSLAGAIALIGFGTLAAGLGLIAFSTGLAALAAALTAYTASIAVNAAGIISAMNIFFEGLMIGFGNGIVAFCDVIAKGAPAIGNAFLAIIESLCDVVIRAVPKVIEAVSTLLTAILDFIVAFVPKVVNAAAQMIIGFLQGIADNVPKIIAAGVNIILSFLRGITQTVPRVIDASYKMMIDMINGMADAIRNNNGDLIAAVNNLMDAAIDAIGDWVSNAFSAGGDIIQGVIDGVKNMSSSLWNAMVSVASSAWDGFLDFFGIASPAKLGIEAGMFVDEGLVVGLKTYSKSVDKAALGVGEGAMETLSGSLSGIVDVINGDIDTQPTIRPVLDLSDIRAGASDISRIFGSGTSVGVEANVGAISTSMAKHNQNGTNDDVVSAINKLGKKLDNVGNTYNSINGVTYDDGSNLNDAVKAIVRAAKIERRTN